MKSVAHRVVDRRVLHLIKMWLECAVSQKTEEPEPDRSGEDHRRRQVSNNVVTGNSGINTLYGLGGNDTLDGGLGADALQGGVGADTFFATLAAGLGLTGADFIVG